MSTDSYSKWWIKAKDKLSKVQAYDQAVAKGPTIKDDRSLAGELLGGLFARYSRVVQDLDTCLDQMTNAQKSFTARKLMDAAATRLHELKEELTKIDISEFHYQDGALIERKLVPHSIEVLHPSLIYPRVDQYEQFWRRLKNDEVIYDPSMDTAETETTSKKKKRVKIVEDPLAMLAALQKKSEPEPEKPEESTESEAVKAEETEETEEDIEKRAEARKALKRAKRKSRPLKIRKVEVLELSEEEKLELAKRQRYTAALVLIQSHERARQGRLYYNDLLNRHQIRKPPSTGTIKSLKVDSPMSIPTASLNKKLDAATVIQSFWRGYRVRKELKKDELRRRLLIGMVEPSWKSYAEKETFRRNLVRRREIRDEARRRYYQAITDEKARILRVVAPGLFEDISDEIREWFRRWYYTTKHFEDIPDEDLGGTVLVIRGDTKTIDEFLTQKGEDKQVAKERARREAEKRKAQEKKEKLLKQKEAAKKKAQKDSNEFEFEPHETPAMRDIKKYLDEYNELWRDVPDHPQNLPYIQPITDEVCYQTQLEVRKKVDEAMRIELDMLRQAFDRDKWQKKKKRGKFKPKKRKKKKKKKKREKRKKDPTRNRKVEDLFQELYRNGIIRTYPEHHLDEFQGDFSYQNWEKRRMLFDPPATLGEVRQAVAMNCIVPLGVESLEKPKSVLIIGHYQSGKHLLANAVFNETGCVLFDLTPSNVVGKYPGKKGKKMLIHLVQKMSRLLAPSIIFIDGAEKPFYKKVPKDEKPNEPKALGKYLFKDIIRPLKPEDRVLVLGISSKPWLAKPGKIKKAFQRVILIPRTDYGSIYLFWRSLLMPYHGVDRNIDLSCLAKLTTGHLLPDIEAAVRRIMVPERLIQLPYKPLSQKELLKALLDISHTVTDKEWKKFRKFYDRTTLGRRRKKLMKVYEEARKKATE